MNNQSLQEKRPSLEFRELASKAATLELDPNSDVTKKDLYEQMADQLIIEGFPLENISLIVINNVEEKIFIRKQRDGLNVKREDIQINRSWAYDVLSKKGCTNPFYARNVKPKDSLDPEPDQGNSSINTQIIEILKKTKVLCDEGIKDLKNGYDLEPILDKETWKVFLHQWNAIVENSIDTMNQKTKVPKNTVSFLLELVCLETTSANAGELFMKRRFQMMSEISKFIDPKQTGKFKRGLVRDQPRIYKPDSRDMSLFMRYEGVQCKNCNSWMVEEITDKRTGQSKHRCIECKHVFKEKSVGKCRYCQIPLYRERLVHIIKTGRCEDCNNELALPDELVEYADPSGSVRRELKVFA